MKRRLALAERASLDQQDGNRRGPNGDHDDQNEDDGGVHALEVRTMAGKRGHQAGVSEHGRMQVVPKVTDVLNERRCTLLEGPQVLLQIRANRQLTKLLPQTAERNRQAGELLTHVVVQVACNACPFGISYFNFPLLPITCSGGIPYSSSATTRMNSMPPPETM